MTGEGHIQVNINTAQFASGKGGSIPTCAGSHHAPSIPTCCERYIGAAVYPHVCGAATGLHPNATCRSIPTCAGQPVG